MNKYKVMILIEIDKDIENSEEVIGHALELIDGVVQADVITIREVSNES